MIVRCASFLLACLSGASALADCVTLPDALPPTAEAESLAARLAQRLPLAGLGTEVNGVSACGTAVYFDYPEAFPQEGAIQPSDRLPDAERVICNDFFTRQFIKKGGSVRGIVQVSSPYVFDLCKGS
jgi:hypothetical protein